MILGGLSPSRTWNLQKGLCLDHVPSKESLLQIPSVCVGEGIVCIVHSHCQDCFCNGRRMSREGPGCFFCSLDHGSISTPSFISPQKRAGCNPAPIRVFSHVATKQWTKDLVLVGCPLDPPKSRQSQLRGLLCSKVNPRANLLGDFRVYGP